MSESTFWNDFLGVFDPYHVITSEPKAVQTEYMRHQNDVIQQYRHWYYRAIEEGVMTVTQMKKKNLYSAHALDEGVSTMGATKPPALKPGSSTPIQPLAQPNLEMKSSGGLRAMGGGFSMPVEGTIDGIPIPISLPPDWTLPEPVGTALPVAEVARIDDQRAQLQEAVEGNTPEEILKKRRIAYNSRERRRVKLLEKQELARRLGMLMDPDDPSKQLEYQDMTTGELRDAIEAATGREEKGNIPDEVKQPRSSDPPGAESSDALEDIESKMIQEERVYTRSGREGYQAIKRGRSQSTRDVPLNTRVSWVALREVIQSSITDPTMTHHGSLLMFSGNNTSQRTRALQSVLSGIADMPDSAQRLLDLIDSFGIDLRDIGTGMTARDAQSNANRNRIIRHFAKLTPAEKRRLLVAFNKLFRNLTERLIEKLEASNVKADVQKLKMATKLYGDLATNVTTDQLAGSQGAPDKPMVTGDFLDAENQQMVTMFSRLLAATGSSDIMISATLEQLSVESEHALDSLTRAAKAEGKDIDDRETQIDIHAAVYAAVVGKILQHIEAMKNMLEARFVKESSLRNNQNLGKLKRTLEQLMDEIKKGIANAKDFVSKPTLVKLRRRMMDFKRVYDGIKVPLPYEDSLTPDGDAFTPPTERMLEHKYDVEEQLGVRITDSDMKAAQRRLRELRESGVDAVTVTVMGNDITVGTPSVVINWDRIPIRFVRQLLIDHINLTAAPLGRAGQELHRLHLEEIARMNQEELFSRIDHTIKDKNDRRRILKQFPIAKEPGYDPDDPDDPDDPPGAGLYVAINGRRILLKITAITSLLILLGVSTAKIVDMIKNGGTAKAPIKKPTKNPDLDTIGSGDNNNGGNNNDPNIDPGENYSPYPNTGQPTFPEMNPTDDPIYGGIGNIQPRNYKFKPIRPPDMDSELGADYIEADANMLNNTALMKLVKRYNDDATRFNELLELRLDLGDEGLSGDELKDLEMLSANMKNQIVAINQQSVAYNQFGEDQPYYKQNEMAPVRVRDSFVASSKESIDKVYPLIPTDKYTQSIGLDDDIGKYNNLAEQYNQLSARYKGYGQDFAMVGETGAATRYRDQYVAKKSEDPAYAAALTQAVALASKIDPILAKINTTMANPERRIGREAPRNVAYNDKQKSLITKVTQNKFESITEEEEKSMRDSPELFRKYERLQQWYKKSLTLPYAKRDFGEYDKLVKEFVDTRNRSMEFQNTTGKLPTDTDWSVIHNDSQKEYVRSKQDFLDAVAAMKQAKNSGATPHRQSQLYNDLENKRLHYERTRQKYEELADNYKHALVGRTSYLADMTDETLPETEVEMADFDRLQQVEKILQHNADALSMYNTEVKSMKRGRSGMDTGQVYQNRMTLLKSISGKYNLQNEYEDAVRSNIHVQVQDDSEDPSTIVDFIPGMDDVGRSTERANFIDPAEQKLFMMDSRDRAEEQRRWEGFSLVQPWNGLGDPRTNPLLDHQVQEYMTRYGKCTKGIMPSMRDMRLLPSNRRRIIRGREQQPNEKADIMFIPTIQATFGQEIWESEAAIPTNNFQSQEAKFTREDNDLPNNRFSTWYPEQGSTYHPDRQIDMNNIDESTGPLLTQNSDRRPVFYGINPRVNEQYSNYRVPFQGGQTLNNNFGHNPQVVGGEPVERPNQKPTSLYDNIDMSARYSMARRR
jgi:hypothetical protein